MSILHMHKLAINVIHNKINLKLRKSVKTSLFASVIESQFEWEVDLLLQLDFVNGQNNFTFFTHNYY